MTFMSARLAMVPASCIELTLLLRLRLRPARAFVNRVFPTQFPLRDRANLGWQFLGNFWARAPRPGTGQGRLSTAAPVQVSATTSRSRRPCERMVGAWLAAPRGQGAAPPRMDQTHQGWPLVVVSGTSILAGLERLSIPNEIPRDGQAKALFVDAPVCPEIHY